MEANAGKYIKKYLHLKRFPRVSLHCRLVPVQYREYEYGLLVPLVENWTRGFEPRLGQHLLTALKTEEKVLPL